MFLSKKFEVFMAVVENGSLSKAARVMNRTTPPIAKSIKDFEITLGKRLFKRDKFGMQLTNDGIALYQDLKDLYQQEKQIKRKYANSNLLNKINIYYDWGKTDILTKIFEIAEKDNIQANILRICHNEIKEISDYDNNTIILTSEPIDIDKFCLIREEKDGHFGAYARKNLINEYKNSIDLLSKATWLCQPNLFKSEFIKNLENFVKKSDKKIDIRQIDNTMCCLKFIYYGNYVFITNSIMDEFDDDSKIDFIDLSQLADKSKIYFYHSKSHATILNKMVNFIKTANL